MVKRLFSMMLAVMLVFSSLSLDTFAMEEQNEEVQTENLVDEGSEEENKNTPENNTMEDDENISGKNFEEENGVSTDSESGSASETGTEGIETEDTSEKNSGEENESSGRNETENESEKNSKEESELSTDFVSGETENSSEENESSGRNETENESEKNSEEESESLYESETEESESSTDLASGETETVVKEEKEIAIDSEENVSLISGNAVENEYTWNFSDVTVGNSDKKTVDYNDGYAAIRVGLGAGDSFEANSVRFSNPSCKEPTTAGFANAGETNRYLLIKPVYSGTISFAIEFPNANNNKKSRIGCIDQGEMDIDKVDISKLVKINDGEASSIGGTISSSASKSLEFTVEAGHTYSLHTYNTGSKISGLKYTFTKESWISGKAEGDVYTWNFTDKAVESGKTGTFNYSDEYAAICVGLGNRDSFADNGVRFSGPSCKETNTSGFKNASETNRYILIKPKQAGTIRFSVQFDDLPSGKVGRVYYIDHGETEISKVMLTDIKKGTTGLGADFKPVAQEERTFDVRAGHVYSIYTYQWDGKGATISGLSMEKSLISGSEENGIYTWKFNKNVDVIASGEKKDFQYSDAYASIRVGLGSGDSVADGNLQFSGPGCKDEDGKCSGYENVSKTNRYILIKPKQAGTIRFLVQFAQGVDSKHKGRVYYIDHGETEIGEVILTDIKKTSGTNLGADFTSTTQEERSFNVQAGHVYSIYTYQYQGYGATISDLSMEKSLISGGVSEDVYTWIFDDVSLGNDETKTYGYSDDHAAISVGLGKGDSFADNSIRFSDTSCKDEDGKCSGYENVSKTNRYILIKPEQAGTIRFLVQFAQGVDSKHKGRVYYIDHGETEIGEVILTDIKKTSGTNLGADFTSTTQEERSFNVQAGHVYSIYTYQYQGYGATISGLCMEESAAISGSLDKDTYIYTWKFEDEQIPSGETKTFRYSDKYAAIGVGLGSEDAFANNNIVFSGSSCKASAKDTNRYITVTPAQAGTIDFKAQFADGVSDSNKGYVYYIDHGKTELSKIDFSTLNQNDKTGQLGDAFSTTAAQELSLPVKAGYTYSLYICNDGNQGATFSELRYAIETINIIQNQRYKEDFENDIDSEKWTTTGNVIIAGDAQDGEQCMQLGKNATASTTITDIPQGSYTVAMWVKGSSSSKPKMTVSGTGGPDSYLKLNPALKNAANRWVQVAHRNVLVYNGQMTLTISADQGLYVDTIQISLDSKDDNTIQNWDFESGMDNWSTKGTAELITDGVDAGTNAVKLADQSEISQKITVKPDTDYIVTARMKVDRQDTFKSTTQYHPDDGTTILGFLVERTSLGNRVNLGVRGASTVLRQAPASTTDYALVTVAFHTGANQTEVEVYANTIYDQNYRDSVTVYENTYGTENTYPGGWQRPNPNKIDTKKLADDWQSNGSNYAYVDNFDIFEVNNDYIKGADMSFLQVIEDCGGKYFANGVQQDALRILSNHGVNSITTMTFVHAGNKIYNWSPIEELSTTHTGFDGEYVTGRQQVDGYFDKTHTIAIAKRAQELGMTFTLGIHYSDTWMTAAKAHMPYEWFEQDYEGNLSNPDIKMLATATYNYVYDLLSDMKQKGVTNLISVKNGNEQNGGILFPIGQGSQYSEHATIVRASIEAVRKVYPGVVNTIHSNTGYDIAQYTGFLNNLKTSGADYDGTAFSLYAGRGVTSQFKMMIAALENDAFKYDDYYNVETAMSFVGSSTIGDSSDSTMVMSDYYDATPNGQYNYLLDYMEAPLEMPNPYGVLRGFYYWNTEAIAVYGAGHKAGEGPGAMKRTMFNNGTVSIKEMGSSEAGKMGDMMDSMYAYLHRGNSKVVSDEVYTPTQYSGIRYSVTEAESITMESKSISLQVGQTQRLRHTIAPEDKLLKDYSVSYQSSNPAIAEVSPFGFVTARAAGTATITATIGGVSDTVSITVSEATNPSGMTISYDIIRNKASVKTGTVNEGEMLAVQPYDKVKFTTKLNGNPTDEEIIYTISDPDIAEWYGQTWQTDSTMIRTLYRTFSNKNYEPVVQLNPRSGGTATVTAQASGDTKVTFTVKVSSDSVTGVTIQGEKERSALAGKKIQLAAAIEPADAVLNKINWSSSDEKVATVDKNGLVTCIAPGTVEITAVSDVNSSAKDTVTLTVSEVEVEEILFSRSKLAVLVGDTKTLSATVLPADAANKVIEWSVEGGSDVVSVENGKITGIKEGTATVAAIAADGSGVKATCIVYVQTTPVAAEGMSLPEEVWIKSNYFSPDVNARGENKPVCQLEALFEPQTTTNTDVTWSSSNSSIASVDANGLVTAHKGGMATITAKAKDGGYTDSIVIYTPTVSEDWENYDAGSAGGFTNDNIFTFAVENCDGNQVLKAVSADSTGISRRSFTRVSGDKIVVEFDWDTGSFVTGDVGRISIEDSSQNTWIEFLAGTNAKLQYAYNGKTENVGSGLSTGANQTYHIHLELNFAQQKVCFTVSSLENSQNKESVELEMSASQNREENVAAIAFSHNFSSSDSWTTAIDNLSIYNASTAVSVEGIEYTVDCINLSAQYGIKLVPVEGALSAKATINAKVLPEDATSKGIVYETSGEIVDWLDVDENGVVTIKEEKRVSLAGAYTVPTLSGKIRMSAVQNPDIYEEITVTIGSPSTSEVITVSANGIDSTEGVIRLPLGMPVELSYVATGGDGITDIYSYKWTVGQNSIGAKITNDILTVESAGKVTVDFELTLFSGDPVKRTLELEFIEVGIAVEGTAYAWGSFQDEDTPGIYFNKAQTIKVTGTAESAQYYLASGEQADKLMTMTEVEKLTEWTNYTESIQLSSDGQYVFYVRLAESNRNTIYISSERLVVDSEPPHITGIEDGKTYTGNITFVVTEIYGLSKVMVDGAEVQLDENGSYTITADNKEHTIIAADKAQNSVTFKITVNKKDESGEQEPTYSVTFVDAQGRQIGETQIVREGADAVEPEAPEREGYTFTGWSGSHKNIRENTVLKAEYQATEYTITYELDGGMNAAENPANYTIETETVELQNPIKEGFTFMGWYDNSAFEGNTVAQIIKGSTGNKTFYAKWIAVDMVCRVTFVDAAGNQIEVQMVEKGKDAIPPAAPERAGYTFAGWGGSYTNVTEDTIITAKYDVITYKIAYELNGGTGAQENPETYTVETETVILQNPTKEGFTFMGWYDNSAFEGNAIAQIIKGSTGDKTFYAKWVATDMICRVTFVDMAGNPIEVQLIEKGKDAIPPAAPERVGYTFAGWDGSYMHVTEDTTITAKYDVITYKIAYELNGGTGAQANPESYTVETETIILQVPEKENFTFMGWYENSAFEGNAITQIIKGSTGNKTFYARWIPIGLWMTEPETQTYTGSAVKPTDFTVYDGITELTAGVDYTISYKNNTKANKLETEAEKKKAPVVIIKGKGNYSGTVTKTFQIQPFDIGSEEIQIDDLAVAYKKNKTQKAVPVVKWGNRKLAVNKDYQIEGNTSYSEPGTYPVTIRGTGNFTGEKMIYFTIASADEKLISKVKLSKIPKQAYSGGAVHLTKELLKLTDGTYTLEEHTDYELEYGECVNAGIYDVLIRGKGKYKGVRRTSFQISGTPITNITTAWDSYTYSGTEQTPKPVIRLKDKGKTLLQEGKDYEIVSYSNNINAGTAKAVIAGRGAYSGTTTISFKIKAADLSGTTIAFMNGTKEQPYEKGGVKPKVIVTFNGETLTEGTDYTVTYKNNTAFPQKAGKEPAVVIRGKKNFSGNRQETFTITSQDISNIALMFAPDVEANKKAGKFYSTPQLFDSNGKKLAAGKDYEKKFIYMDADGNELSKADKPEAGAVIMVLVKGKGAYEGEKTAEYRILPKGVNIAKAKVKLQNKFYYTGSDIIPKADDLKVTLKSGKSTYQLELGTDYKLIPYPNNPKKGKLKFLLAGQNDFGGTKTVTITVRPQIMKWR